MRPLRSFLQPTPLWNPAKQQREMIRYVDVSAVSRETLEIESSASIVGKEAPNRARKIVREDDTIFATIRPTLNRVAKVPAELDNEIVSTAFCVLRPDKTKVDADYLFFLASSDAFIASVAEHETGASYPAVRDRDVLDQDVDIPELVDQCRIAKALIALRKAALKEFEILRVAAELKSAVMTKLFTGGLRDEVQKETEIGLIPESWLVVKLGSVGKIGNGTTPNRQNPAYWEGGTVPWITSGRMYEREISESESSVTPLALKESSLPLLQPGAVLIAIVGQGKTLGHCAILTVEATVSRHVGFVQPQESSISSGFLRGYLESQYEYLRQLASGNGSTRGALTGAMLKSLLIPLPPLDEQNEIVTILDTLDRKISVHQQKRAILEKLFKSLLDKLMAGEIQVGDLDLAVLSAPPVQVAETVA